MSAHCMLSNVQGIPGGRTSCRTDGNGCDTQRGTTVTGGWPACPVKGRSAAFCSVKVGPSGPKLPQSHEPWLSPGPEWS